ncbi:hypothetical protein [Microbacterium sp.]|uniref:RNA polymerase sigma factor n=1 Tax=Microbacterium sp. TaxID=51671 RepID=UPI0033424FD0
MDAHGRTITGISDAALLEGARTGVDGAFAQLIDRHIAAAGSAAETLVGLPEAQDVLDDAIVRAGDAVVHGDVPDGAFRAFLLAQVRWASDARGLTVRAPARVVRTAGDIPTAFGSLPVRKREVLWYTDVEQQRPSVAGVMLGMSVGDVSELSIDARSSLHAAWVRSHLDGLSPAACRWTLERLGYGPGAHLGERAQAKQTRHLSACPRCREVVEESRELASRLPEEMLATVLGVVGAQGYLAAAGGISAEGPVRSRPVASAASRAAVERTSSGRRRTRRRGAAALIASAAASSAGANAAAAAAAGAGVSTGAAVSAGGALAGAGALVGGSAAAAAIIVAGTVIAGTLSPAPIALLDSAAAMTPDTATGQTAERPTTVNTAAVDADPGPSPAPTLAPIPTPAPVPEVDDPAAGEEKPIDPQSADPKSASPEPVEPAPVEPAPVPPVDPKPVEPAPVPPVDPKPVDPAPVPPVDPKPVDPAPAPPVDPKPVDPVPVDPAPVDPKPVDPAPVDPAPVDPAPVDPVPVDPVPVDPDPSDPDPLAAAPILGADVQCTWEGEAEHRLGLTLRIPLSGVAGARVLTQVDGQADSVTPLGPDGRGVSVVRLSGKQIVLARELVFRYVSDRGTGTKTASLSIPGLIAFLGSGCGPDEADGDQSDPHDHGAGDDDAVIAHGDEGDDRDGTGVADAGGRGRVPAVSGDTTRGQDSRER